MSADELTEGVFETRKRFYSWRSIGTRLFATGRAVLTVPPRHDGGRERDLAPRDLQEAEPAAGKLTVRITFIKPNIGRMEHSLYVDEGRMEPLMLAVLAGMTPPDVECVLYDDRMEPIPYDEPTDLAAITVETYTARRGYEIAAEYRASAASR